MESSGVGYVGGLSILESFRRFIETLWGRSYGVLVFGRGGGVVSAWVDEVSGYNSYINYQILTISMSHLLVAWVTAAAAGASAVVCSYFCLVCGVGVPKRSSSSSSRYSPADWDALWVARSQWGWQSSELLLLVLRERLALLHPLAETCKTSNGALLLVFWARLRGRN